MLGYRSPYPRRRRRYYRSPSLVAVFLALITAGALYYQKQQREAARAAEAGALLKAPEAAEEALPADSEKAKVAKVLDGDSGELADGRGFRLIGIDAPEVGEPFHDDAKRRLDRLIGGREVRLTFDVEEADTHKRRLVFVHVSVDDRSILVNAEMLRLGLAQLYYPGENEKHKERLLAAQREARKEKRGIWKDAAPEQGLTFVGTKRGHAFHRAGCGTLSDAKGGLLKWPSRDEAVDAGRSPCRTCKP